MWRLAGWYCGVLESALAADGVTDTQSLSLLGNAHYLLVVLIPDILRSLPGQVTSNTRVRCLGFGAWDQHALPDS